MAAPPAIVALEIPSRSVYVGVVRLALSSLARQAGLDEEVVDDLKIAVSEACANAVLSNEEAGGSAPVSVSWFEEEDRLVVEISDRGPVFDPEAASSDRSDPATARFDMSVALLKSLVDGYEFSAREGGGMSTRLVFTR